MSVSHKISEILYKSSEVIDPTQFEQGNATEEPASV